MPENLYKRGKTWWGRIQSGGREHRKSLHTTDRKEADRRLRAWREEIGHAVFYGEARHTFKAATVKWAKEFLFDSVKPATSTRYLSSLAQLDPHFNSKFVDEIDKKMVGKFISARKELGATNATIRRDLTALSSILSCCVAWSWRDDNPAKEFDRSIIKERRDPIKPPSHEDVEAVIKRAEQYAGDGYATSAHLLIRFLSQTGMRLDEACSLEWPQIDLKRGAITLTKTKTNRPRVVPLDDLITSAAAGTLAGTPRHITSKVVFWHGDGERYTQFSSRFNKLAAAAKVRFRCHDLRHKFAIDYLIAGGDIYRLSKVLGHTSVKTTEIYLGHIDLESARGSAQGKRFDEKKTGKSPTKKR